MKIISFVNMKGGVGKTTLALNAADCLARNSGKKVAVIDVDPQFNLTQCMISGPEYVEHLEAQGDTILDVFDPGGHPQAGIVEGTTITPTKELKDIKFQERRSISILPGNIRLYLLEMQSGEGREFSIQRLVEQNLEPAGFDYVIIDTPPTPSIWMTSALIASDYYVIPVKPDPLSLIGIDLLRDIINRRIKSYNIKIKCLGLVFTMVERVDSISYKQARKDLEGNEYWKDYILDGYIPKRAELARNQLTQPYILETNDFDLRTQLIKVVDNFLN